MSHWVWWTGKRLMFGPLVRLSFWLNYSISLTLSQRLHNLCTHVPSASIWRDSVRRSIDPSLPTLFAARTYGPCQTHDQGRPSVEDRSRRCNQECLKLGQQVARRVHGLKALVQRNYKWTQSYVIWAYFDPCPIRTSTPKVGCPPRRTRQLLRWASRCLWN